jgi:hypothetical protein
VPLRDLDAFHAWIKREDPTLAAQRVARAFIAELGDRPWRAPSVPIAELSHQPEYELRSASLPVDGERDAEVWYQHTYATGDVDLVAVTNH